MLLWELWWNQFRGFVNDLSLVANTSLPVFQVMASEDHRFLSSSLYSTGVLVAWDPAPFSSNLSQVMLLRFAIWHVFIRVTMFTRCFLCPTKYVMRKAAHQHYDCRHLKELLNKKTKERQERQEDIEASPKTAESQDERCTGEHWRTSFSWTMSEMCGQGWRR